MQHYKLNADLKMAVWQTLQTEKMPSVAARTVFEQRPDLQAALCRYLGSSYVHVLLDVEAAIATMDAAWELQFPTREVPERERRRIFSDLIEGAPQGCTGRLGGGDEFITHLIEIVYRFVSDPRFIDRRSRSIEYH